MQFFANKLTACIRIVNDFYKILCYLLSERFNVISIYTITASILNNVTSDGNYRNFILYRVCGTGPLLITKCIVLGQ
jgi:hypothetical protein